MSGRMRGRSAVVTGGASGIGAATAALLAEEGASVWIADIDERAAQAAVDAIRKHGGWAEARRVDVSDAPAFEAALRDVAREHGQLDVLVCCAFQMVTGSVESLSTEDWHRCMQVTLDGTFFGVRAALRIMRPQRSGAIVNTSSLAGQYGQPSMVGYGCAKAAVDSLTRTAALEAAPLGIRVNAVSPGCVATPGTLGVFPEGTPQRAAAEKMMPTGRLLEPAELARAILFLASDDASGVNGHILTVDSGQSVGLDAPELEAGWEH